MRPQEKAVILLPSPYIPASTPDTELFIRALNAADLDAFAPRLSPDVEMTSEDGKQVMSGQSQILRHFATRLEDLQDSESGDYIAVAGVFRRLDAPDAPEGGPCAIFYDGFCKSCVLQLGMGNGRLVDRIVLSSRNSTLRRAWPIEPPAFRSAAILPSLADLQPER